MNRATKLGRRGQTTTLASGMKWFYYALLATAVMSHTASPAAVNSVATNAVFQRIELPGIHNALRATDRVFSGSQPEGDEAFVALAKLGVKTLVSVDGGLPDVATARKHGLRYVHLPFGYDGIPTNRVAELAKLTAESNGPFFVHCHHGLHRGPAAVAVMCQASASWTPATAEAWLHEAGTSPDYPGLYRAARQFQRPTAEQLAAVKELPEVTKPSSFVEAMVAIDEHFARLKASQKAGWKTPPGHADISPPHEATLLWEQLRELARTDDTKQRPEEYRMKLNDCERAADSLRNVLMDSPNNAAIDAQFKVVTQTCSSCHRTYRNQ